MHELDNETANCAAGNKESPFWDGGNDLVDLRRKLGVHFDVFLPITLSDLCRVIELVDNELTWILQGQMDHPKWALLPIPSA